MRGFRRLALCACSLGLGLGCRTARVWNDLSAPAEWQALESAPVKVAGREGVLPIVVGTSADEQWAAMFLAKTIDEVCGRRPEIYVDAGDRKCDFAEGLFIGSVAANAGWACEKGGSAAFRVVSGGGCVRFLGRADYAVFDWCERELGLRYYGKEGKCVRKASEIVSRAADWTDWPVYAHRMMGSDRADAWLRVAKQGSEHNGGVAVHQPHRWYADKALRAEHPGIFESGETPMLCYGNPETLDYYKRRIGRHIAGLEDSGGIVDSRRKVVTVCQWDAPIKCRCEHCRGLYDPDLGDRGSASPIIWGRFLSDLAFWLKTAHPDYEISFLPYLNTCEVPKTLRVRKTRKWRRWHSGRSERKGLAAVGNAEAEVCTMPGLASLKDGWCKRKEERILMDWKAATGRKVLSWDYGCWPQEWTSAPYVFGETIQSHYVDMRETLCGAYVCGGATDARLQLSMYVWMRCLWNPDIDIGAVYDEFAKRMFGPAAKPMRELIDLQEEGWNRPWENGVCSYHNIHEVSYPRETVNLMRRLLEEARTLVDGADNAEFAAHVDWYASGFRDFFAESDELAARQGRLTVFPGTTNALVVARDVWYPQPWANTWVTTSVEAETLMMNIRCEEPAVAKMDFSRAEDNFVWGTDHVTVIVSDGEEFKTTEIDLAGGVKNGWDGFSATVSHDSTGWTVKARIRLSDKAVREGRLTGNVCRWRVGDRRMPADERVSGSRYEHSRLGTCYTAPDDDPAAFVTFSLQLDRRNADMID